MKKFNLILLIIFLFLSINIIYANTKSNQIKMYSSTTNYKWAITEAYSIVNSNNLVSNLTFQNLKPTGAYLITTNISYRLSKKNGLSKFFSFLNAKLEPSIGLTYWFEKKKKIPEVDVFLNFRWINFPWNNFIATTMAIGEGCSYMASIPKVELDKTSNSAKFMNFLTFDLTLANPKYPMLQYVLYFHHRSGAWKTYGTSLNAGSNAIGFGLRYYI